nr:hypothetical protein [Tanacetum cinerariifolium]
LDTEKLQELTVADSKSLSSTPSSSSPKPTLSMSHHILSLFKPKTRQFKRYKSFFDELQGRYGYLFRHLKTRFLERKKFNVLAQHLQEVMEDSLPNMVDDHVKELTKTQVYSLVRNYMTGHILHVHPTQANQASAQEQQYQLYLTMKDNPNCNMMIYQFGFHLRSSLKDLSLLILLVDLLPFTLGRSTMMLILGENSVKRQKTSEHGSYVMGEYSSGQSKEGESGL